RPVFDQYVVIGSICRIDAVGLLADGHCSGAAANRDGGLDVSLPIDLRDGVTPVTVGIGHIDAVGLLVDGRRERFDAYGDGGHDVSLSINHRDGVIDEIGHIDAVGLLVDGHCEWANAHGDGGHDVRLPINHRGGDTKDTGGYNDEDGLVVDRVASGQRADGD